MNECKNYAVFLDTFNIFSGKHLKMEKEFDTFSKIGYDQKTLYKMMNSFAKIKKDTKV